MIDAVIDRHKNKTAICIGHGPSLDTYHHKLKSFKDDGVIFYGSNNWFDYYDIPPNYWTVCGALENNLKNQFERLTQIKSTTFLYSETYDSNNYDDYKFNFECLKYNSTTDKTSIQHKLMKYTNSNIKYGVGCNTGLHVITLAILMGCNPIYLIGFDVDHGLGFAKNTSGYTVDYINSHDPKSTRKDYIDNYVSDLKTINDSAKNININILNLNDKSIYDVFTVGKL